MTHRKTYSRRPPQPRKVIMTRSAARRLGVVFRPQWAPERLAAAARTADDDGVDELWLWEDCFLAGGVSAAAIALANSSRLTVGVGVLPAPMRNVAVTAMEIATLHRAFPGRVRIGIGHGVQDWMGQIGARVASPMTFLREYLTTLSALLRGETVSYDGRYVHLDGVALDWPPVGPVEVLAAAVGPRTLALSGELASGTVLTGGTTPQQVRAAIGHIGAAEDHAIVTYLLCATGVDAQTRILREVAHWELSPDDDVYAAGDAAQVAAAARRWYDAGTQTVVLQPAADDDIDAFFAFAGAEVKPLLA
jgi:alkanesulfonate monooxygenase SsuD/methylene tetrahydromethanopterin reductase-like flavin-dependent oxidoreductase (luciferase family)